MTSTIRSDQPERVRLAEINAFSTPESPSAYHEKPSNSDKHRDPDDRIATSSAMRSALHQMHHCGDASRPAGNRHTDKILAPRTTGVRRLRIHRDIEARQPGCASGQEYERGDGAKLDEPPYSR